MIHLRLIVPVDLAPTVFQHLSTAPGVAHVAQVPATNAMPPGELLLCDVAREAANDIVEWLQRQDIHHTGAISIEALEGVVSDSAERASAQAPGQAGDALIWEELEARARSDASLTASFLIFIGIAAVIAGIGILSDSPVLIVGAMVVGPEYGPLSALCIAAARRRVDPAVRALVTLTVGLAIASAASFVATLAFRAAELGPDGYVLSDRQLTAFISNPDGLAAIVAVLAGVAGMLSLTEARSGALIGVLVSVTTIPAAANIGVAAAFREWSEVGGSALQLVINVTGLVLAGLLTLMVQSRATTGVGA